MASSLALKRLLSSNLLLKPVSPIAAVAQSASSRLFNTNAVRDYYNNDGSLDVDHRSDRAVSGLRDFLPNQLSDVIDPFYPFRRGWDVRETDDSLCLRVEMPGLGKEDVKVSVEQNTLVIKGVPEKELDDEESGRRCTLRINLPHKLYKTSEIKAEMKDGILKVMVPKVKEEERTDVFHVKVE